jgi:hypothetical protein
VERERLGIQAAVGVIMILLFEGDWRALPEPGVSAMRIVPAFDVAEDGEPGLDRRGEAVPGEQLAFERREEALDREARG